jgi:tetratricopeptide (TPR) repeat protein
MSELDEARALFEQATSAFQGADYERAADLFAELLIHPGLDASNMPEIHWNLGVCFIHAGNLDLARQHFQAGGYSESDYGHLISEHERAGAAEQFRQAVEVYEGGDYSRAADLFAELLLDPGMPADQMGTMHWDMGMCYFHLGNLDLARQHFEAGGFSESEYGPVFQEQHTQEASRLFQEAVQVYEGGDYSRASDLFAELMFHPGMPADQMGTMHWDMGMCFFHLGDDDLGRQHMQAGGFSESDYADEYQRVVAARTP